MPWPMDFGGVAMHRHDHKISFCKMSVHELAIRCSRLEFLVFDACFCIFNNRSLFLELTAAVS